MKRINIVLGLAGCMFVLFFTRVVYAQEDSLTAIPASTPIQMGVDYTLPYPGLLPDNPLYFLKSARDKILEFFISNPIKKADFDLLQSDKRVESSYLLIAQKKKVVLADSTLSKAENYFEDAISKGDLAKKQGMDTHDLVKRLSLANLKHLEVISNIEDQLKGDDRKKFALEAERVRKLGKMVKELSQ